MFPLAKNSPSWGHVAWFQKGGGHVHPPLSWPAWLHAQIKGLIWIFRGHFYVRSPLQTVSEPKSLAWNFRGSYTFFLWDTSVRIHTRLKESGMCFGGLCNFLVRAVRCATPKVTFTKKRYSLICQEMTSICWLLQKDVIYRRI